MALVEKEVTRRLVLDVDKCMECKSCAAACYYSHAGMPAVNFADIGAAMLPVMCRQCEDSPCVAACPVEAMKRDESGVVYRGLFRCIGCGSCARACPFGVLNLELTGNQMPKCDLCADLLAGGGQPRCVTVCPTGAIRFATEEEIEAEGLLVLGGRLAGHHPLKRR